MSRPAPEIILEIARAAGRELVGPSPNGEYLIQCPRPEKHKNGDAHPSCRLDPAKGVFYCDPCGWGGGVMELAEALGVNLGSLRKLERSVRPNGTKAMKSSELLFHSSGPITSSLQASIAKLLNKNYTAEAWEKAGVHEGTVNSSPAIAFPLTGGGWKACLYTKRDHRRGKPYTFVFTDGGKADLILVGDAEEVLLAAGEWDMLAALSSGFECVATSTGGEKSWKPEWTTRLSGKRVLIVYDVDTTGRAGAAKVAEQLVTAGVETYVVELPLSGSDDTDGKDLSDFLALNETTALHDLIEEVRKKGAIPPPGPPPRSNGGGDSQPDSLIAQISQILRFVPPDADEAFKDSVFKRLLPLLARLDPVAQDLITRTVKEKLGAGLGAIREEIRGFRPQVDSSPPQEPDLPEPPLECRDLLQDPNLLQRFLDDTTALGLIGEEKTKVTILFVMTSRLCQRPMNAVVKGESSVGKNHAVTTIARCFPPTQVVNITTLSPQSLSYWDGDLIHKILIVAEAEGAARAEYTFRVLQSEGHLTVYYVAKVGGELKTIEKTVEGPAATITTTTRESLHPENETRLIEIALDESAEQTGRITALQAKQKAEGLDPEVARAIVERWRGAQALLQPLPVVIPFAEAIRFPSKQVRARRDFPKLLTLIEVSAFLHQLQRERKEIRGRTHITADIRDYAIAYDLLHGFVERVQSGLNDREVRVRDELERRSPERLTARQVADALGWYQEAGRKRAKRCLDSLHDKGWVDATEAQPGAATLYWFRGAPTPTEPGISTPDELAEAISRQGGHLPTTWTSPLSRSKAKE